MMRKLLSVLLATAIVITSPDMMVYAAEVEQDEVSHIQVDEVETDDVEIVEESMEVPEETAEKEEAEETQKENDDSQNKASEVTDGQESEVEETDGNIECAGDLFQTQETEIEAEEETDTADVAVVASYTRISRVSRDDGTWLFPLSSAYWNKFSDWAGCPGYSKCSFCGVVHSSWGDNAHTGQSYGHNGFDIGVSTGTSVLAAAPGTVVYTGYNSARGNYVIIEHPISGTDFSYYSYYQHLNSFSVSNGASVKAGDTIAKSGNSGVGTGAHLHFGIVIAQKGTNISSRLSQIENNGWVTGSANKEGRILVNPSTKQQTMPTGNSAVVPPLAYHSGSVTYTFDKSKVTIGSGSPASTLTITGQSSPGNLQVGSRWTCTGTISSNYIINQVSGYILKNDNSTPIYSKTVNPNSKSYVLQNSAVDIALLFNELSGGTYYYKITASDSSGKSATLINEKFTIVGQCSFSGQVTNPANGTIIYTPQINVHATATDNYEISYFKIKVAGDGGINAQEKTVSAIKSGSTYICDCNIDLAAKGKYTVTVSAECKDGKTHTVGSATFTYERHDCGFTLGSLGPYIRYTDESSTMSVTFNACDYYGISKYNIYMTGLRDSSCKWETSVEPYYFVHLDDGRYQCLYEGSLRLDLPADVYEVTVDAICNDGVVHGFCQSYIVNKVYTITYVIDKNTSPISDLYYKGDKLQLPDTPVREGYFFNGWYTEKDGKGTKFTDSTEITADLTLYAYWVEDLTRFGDVLPEDVPDDRIIPDGIWAAGITDVTYNGGAIRHSFRVYDGNRLLKDKVDYTVSYKNNKNVYMYNDTDYSDYHNILLNTGRSTKSGGFDPNKAPQVVIRMKGNYSGSQTIYYKIRPVDITGDGFNAGNLTATYSGKKQTPVPALTWNGKTLKYNTDFYIPEYDNARNDKTAFTESGTYDLTVVGKNNFTGEIPVRLIISASSKQIAISSVTIKGIGSQAWTGQQIKPDGYTVKYKTDVLSEENGDYTVSIGENTAVGIGTVTLTGTGTDNDGDGYSYIGTKTVSFRITGTAMNKVVVSGVDKSYTYTGTAIEPDAVLSYKASKNASPVTLVKDTHYTVTYQKNQDKGTATIVFTGLESSGYTGTKKTTFKIVASGIADKTEGENKIEQIRISFKDAENIRDGIYVAPYMKSGAKPEVIVTSGDKTLVPGKDYTVSYANNKKIALSTDEKAPTITVKGKGDYSGSKKVAFTIASKPLSEENGITVVAKDKAASTKKNGYRQRFTVYDADGKKLGSSDYDSKNVVYTLIQTKDKNGAVKTVNDTLDKDSIVPANSVIRITVQGKGNYAGGSISGTYRILQASHDISKATIQINNQEYTGQPVMITEQSQFKPNKVYIKIDNEKRELILGKDIEVVPNSYVKNVNKGTAKVTFRGINEFGGTKTVSYKIGTRSITDFWKGVFNKITGFMA